MFQLTNKTENSIQTVGLGWVGSNFGVVPSQFTNEKTKGRFNPYYFAIKSSSVTQSYNLAYLFNTSISLWFYFSLFQLKPTFRPHAHLQNSTLPTKSLSLFKPLVICHFQYPYLPLTESPSKFSLISIRNSGMQAQQRIKNEGIEIN